MPYIPCPRCGHGYDTGTGCTRCRAPRNETEAFLTMEAAAFDRAAEAAGLTPAAARRIEVLASDAERGIAIPIRKPGDPADVPADDRGTFADDPIRPGERIIGGRRFYSAAWL